jgi:peptidoglycan lytic transglycosylase G
MSKRSFRIALIAVVSSLVVLAIIAAVLVAKALRYPDARHAGAGKPVAIEIRSGMSIATIARALADKEVIDKPTWFRLYAMWRGATSSVKTGNYMLRDDLSPKEVLDALLAGVKDVTTDVAVPEGLNMLEVFALIEKSGVAKAGELEKLARDPEFLQKHGIAGDSVEGYLFPATYNFRVPEKPPLVLERMIDKHREVWNEIATRKKTSLRKLEDRMKWSDHDVLTLASIVEKEAVRADEHKRIAQVFVNRLADPDFKPKRLETDPTIRYGCEVPPQKSAACTAWDRGRLHDAQLHDKDNPYNTYEHEGLPPGPISNPGKGAMEGAADPDGSEYFYFVAKPDGSHSHAFARSYDEHKKNVEKYVHGS